MILKYIENFLEKCLHNLLEISLKFFQKIYSSVFH